MSYIIKEQRTFTWRGKDYHAAQLDPTSTNDVSEDYIKLGDGWRVFADTIRSRVELAGVPEPWDGAVPQSWFDAHAAEIKQRGGWVIWAYTPGEAALFGQPMFADEINKRAAEACSAMILEAAPQPA